MSNTGVNLGCQQFFRAVQEGKVLFVIEIPSLNETVTVVVADNSVHIGLYNTGRKGGSQQKIPCVLKIPLELLKKEKVIFNRSHRMWSWCKKLVAKYWSMSTLPDGVEITSFDNIKEMEIHLAQMNPIKNKAAS